jgi:hypothetical protein
MRPADEKPRRPLRWNSIKPIKRLKDFFSRLAED